MAKKKTNRITSLPETMMLLVDDEWREVETERYAKAKVKALREFGYNNLSLDAVTIALLRIANNESSGVIGAFMVDEVSFEKEPNQ